MERHNQHDNRIRHSVPSAVTDAGMLSTLMIMMIIGGDDVGECRRAMQFQNVSSRRALHPDYITITSMPLQRRFLWQRKNMHR